MPELLEVSLYGYILTTGIIQHVDKRKVMTKFCSRFVITIKDSIMDSTLQWLYISTIQIIAHIIAKAPYNSHIGVCVLQTKEILTTNPSGIVLVTSLQNIHK